MKTLFSLLLLLTLVSHTFAQSAGKADDASNSDAVPDHREAVVPTIPFVDLESPSALDRYRLWVTDDVDASLQSLDVYAPAKGSEYPIVVWLHGGVRRGKDSSLRKESFAISGFDGISLTADEGRVDKKISATIKGWKLPSLVDVLRRRKPFDKMFRCLSHHFRHRPVLLFRDFLQSPVQRVWELNLGSNHDVRYTLPSL